MSTLNTVADMVNYVNGVQGMITLWRPDNSEPQWRTAVGEDFNSLIQSNKFFYFYVPYPLLFVDNSNNGKFHFGRQWTYKNMSVAVAGRATNANKDNQSIDCSSVRGDHDCQTQGFPRVIQSSNELFCYLQTDTNIWLPYVIIPADGSVGSYDRKVFFPPVFDGVGY